MLLEKNATVPTTGLHVLIVDDSALVRTGLGQLLEGNSIITRIETAVDPLYALEKMHRRWPDVILLDVEMPRMDGISFLKEVMRIRPTPTIVFSTLTEKGARITLDAFAAGAVDVIAKPRVGVKESIKQAAQILLDAVTAASQANLAAIQARLATRPERPSGAKRIARVLPAKMSERIVALGTSAGGTTTLERILRQLNTLAPGVLIVQHMPEKFTAAFANRLNELCEIEVREASDGDSVRPGVALIAPGNRHMRLKRSGARYFVEVVDGPLVSRHRPSVDVLFRSVAQQAGPNALGIILTGMGDDGAAGLLKMRESGGRTLAQDKATSIVYGMPNAAIKRDAAEASIALDDIPTVIQSFGITAGEN